MPLAESQPSIEEIRRNQYMRSQQEYVITCSFKYFDLPSQYTTITATGENQEALLGILRMACWPEGVSVAVEKVY